MFWKNNNKRKNNEQLTAVCLNGLFCDSLEKTLITQSLIYIYGCSVMGTPLRQATGRQTV